MKKIKNKLYLLALFVTLIVLLILAAVSLSALTGGQGLFKRAKEATEIYSREKAREKLELTLTDAQVIKYTEGLTDEELSEKINEIGEELEERKNPNISQAIVDGYIFSIDRTVPKILDYIGPADGVIITAKVTQNGDWKNPVATVTGTITKYGGGSVTKTTVTATNDVTIPSNFPTTGGNYIIPNIITDTDIIITTTDSEGETVTKTIQVRLIRDTTPPILSEAKAEAIMMKIKISVKAVDNESGLKQINYSVSPKTIKPAEDGTTRDTGELTSGQELELETTAEGKYTVTFTATDNANNITNPGLTVTATTIDAISVADAKKLINESNIREYIGTKVDYQSPDGGTWRVFYYDAEEKNADGTGKGVGYFGPKNTVYLKRDYGEVWASGGLKLSTKTENTDPAVAMMRRMNPKWRDSSYSVIDLNNEKASVWLCDPEVWNKQKNNTYSSFAIGSPSLEMYMKAYNIWKTGNKNANNLVCKVEHASGYFIGSGDVYLNVGDQILRGVIEPGPTGTNIFCEQGEACWWLASPSAFYGNGNCLPYTQGNIASISNIDFNRYEGICPIVPLDL